MSLTPEFPEVPAAFPLGTPMIAVFWLPTAAAVGSVFVRETTDSEVLAQAQSEVNIQYRYGSEFQVQSVVILTWALQPMENSPKNV